MRNFLIATMDFFGTLIFLAIYIISRIIKSVAWWAPIDVYVLWKHDKKQVNVDAGIVTTALLLYIFGIWFGAWWSIAIVASIWLILGTIIVIQLYKLSKYDKHYDPSIEVKKIIKNR